jgi:hypothetical protein
VKEIFDNLLLQAGFGIVAFMEKQLRGDNYISEWVLQESHFIVRISPRDEITYCEISSCNAEFYLLFVKLVKPITISTSKMRVWSHQMTIGRTEPRRLRADLEKIIQKVNLRIVEFIEYDFSGGGFTWGFVFEDGKGFANFHSFPEDGKTDCEVTFFSRREFVLIIGMLDDQLYSP